MATGDQADVVSRLKAWLPPTWFPNTSEGQPTNSPVLDGLLNGVAWVWAQSYSLLQFAKAQTRIATASGVFLDMIAWDFFGSWLQRRNAEFDNPFRTRIQQELFRQKATRAGLITALTELTGTVPGVFEPAYPLDTGGYGHTGMTVGTGLGYGVAGGYGDLNLPFQFFLRAYLPTGGGIANVAGWGGGLYAEPLTDENGNQISDLTVLVPFYGMPGGYGVGAIEYADLSMVNTQVTEQDIYDTINNVRPAATIAWTAIVS
jgi:hypothetical protein